MSFYPAERAAEILAAYRAWSADEPDGMNTAVLLMRLPPAPTFPRPLRGRQVVAIRVFAVTDEVDRPSRGRPLLDAAGPALWTRSRSDRSRTRASPPTGPTRRRCRTGSCSTCSTTSVTTCSSSWSPKGLRRGRAVRVRRAAALGRRDGRPRPGRRAGRAPRDAVLGDGRCPLPHTRPHRRGRTGSTGSTTRWLIAPPATRSSTCSPTRTDGHRPSRRTTTPGFAPIKRRWDPEDVFRPSHHIPPAYRHPEPQEEN